MVHDDAFFEPSETFFVNLSGATNATIADDQGVGTILNDDAQGGIFHFTSATYSVVESWRSVLIIDAPVDENLRRAAANVPHLDVLPQQGANVYDILRRETLVLTRAAVQSLQERLK